MNPSCKSQCADVRWVMAYGYKTQSFLKNGGRQKRLDKALIMQADNRRQSNFFTYNDIQIHMQYTQQLTDNKKIQSQDWATLRLEEHKIVYAWLN